MDFAKVSDNKGKMIVAGIFLVGGLVTTAYFSWSAHNIKKDIKNDYTLLHAYHGMSVFAAGVGGIVTAISLGSIVHILNKK